ncbi:hypothetical protein DFH06DRAFT_1483950 [Mycena polygramma]|nr:hypothetical protein DFH06DRAFT_1483950 [Mycena polygramma]
MLDASLEAIDHRGPDFKGTFISDDCRVGLGHYQLSIIDLETGNQPLSDEDDMIHCVVTGEIYDHERMRAELEAQGAVCKTKSDSEIVVQLYKLQSFNALSSLRGEFTFVLYDANRRLLFAARDRFGVKPLSYTIIVNNGYFTDDRTVFKGVRKLMPGQYLVFRPDGYLKIQPYYDVEYASQDAPTTSTVEEMITTDRSHLREAVRLRLRADVPVGLYLSGGIDSAAVGGIATEILREKDPAAKLTTFTLTFPYSKQFDEGPTAARTAAFIGADSYEVPLTEADLVNALEEPVWHCEQPVFSFQCPGKFLLSKFAREKGFKVVLTGEGSDEFMGGYAWHLADYLLGPDRAGVARGLDLPLDEERAAMLQRIPAHRGVLNIFISPYSHTDALILQERFNVPNKPLFASNYPSSWSQRYFCDVFRLTDEQDHVRHTHLCNWRRSAVIGAIALATPELWRSIYLEFPPGLPSVGSRERLDHSSALLELWLTRAAGHSVSITVICTQPSRSLPDGLLETIAAKSAHCGRLELRITNRDLRHFEEIARGQFPLLQSLAVSIQDRKYGQFPPLPAAGIISRAPKLEALNFVGTIPTCRCRFEALPSSLTSLQLADRYSLDQVEDLARIFSHFPHLVYFGTDSSHAPLDHQRPIIAPPLKSLLLLGNPELFGVLTIPTLEHLEVAMWHKTNTYLLSFLGRSACNLTHLTVDAKDVTDELLTSCLAAVPHLSSFMLLFSVPGPRMRRYGVLQRTILVPHLRTLVITDVTPTDYAPFLAILRARPALIHAELNIRPSAIFRPVELPPGEVRAGLESLARGGLKVRITTPRSDDADLDAVGDLDYDVFGSLKARPYFFAPF